jgi:hypothetical protein
MNRARLRAGRVVRCLWPALQPDSGPMTANRATITQSGKGRLPTIHVRREKALVFSGCKSRPGTGSLHPVAVETAAEVTKPLKPSMERVAMATWRACRP